MERQIIKIYCETESDLPSIDRINELEQNKSMKVVFGDELNHYRESVGNKWKKELTDFVVGVHMKLPEINIWKLISDQDIVDHYEFFEQCAKDYGKLGKKLITQLAGLLKVEINPDDPDEFRNHLFTSKHTTEDFIMGDWRYFPHGYHCQFTHIDTGQQIEVPIHYGTNYGALDPYFFSLFIKSSPAYKPLPTEIYMDFHDGFKILEIMGKMGKFEKIEGVFEGWFAYIVKDRD
jgi:hypothetical protein